MEMYILILWPTKISKTFRYLMFHPHIKTTNILTRFIDKMSSISDTLSDLQWHAQPEIGVCLPIVISMCSNMFFVVWIWLPSFRAAVILQLIQIRLDSQLFVSVTVIAWDPTAVGRIRSSGFTELFDICRITLLSFSDMFFACYC